MRYILTMENQRSHNKQRHRGNEMDEADRHYTD